MNNLNIIGPDPLDENLDEKDTEIADSNTLLSISNHPNINKLSADLQHATVQFDRYVWSYVSSSWNLPRAGHSQFRLTLDLIPNYVFQLHFFTTLSAKFQFLWAIDSLKFWCV